MSSATTARLSQRDIDTYRATGHTLLRGVLDANEVRTLRARTAAIASGDVPFPAAQIEFEPDGQRARHIDSLRKVNRPGAFDAVFAAHARHPVVLDAVEALIGPDIKLFDDQLFVKPPGGMEKTFHQDSAYFSIEPMDMVTAWIALDDVTVENGCLYIVPGSHVHGVIPHSERWMVGDREDMTVPASAIDALGDSSNGARYEERPVVVKAGDCSFHHSLVLHRSGPNLTSTRRRAIAVHYMSARSKWTDDSQPMPEYPLVRGQTYPGCV